MFVAFMPLHILFCVDVCLCIFLYRSRSTFKFKFESNEFENIKGFIKRKGFSLSNLGYGLKPGCWPTWAGCLACRMAQLGPSGTQPLTDQPDPLGAKPDPDPSSYPNRFPLQNQFCPLESISKIVDRLS
jgi:hypothetical protein